ARAPIVVAGGLGFCQRYFTGQVELAGPGKPLAQRDGLTIFHIARSNAQWREFVLEHRIVERAGLRIARQRGTPRLTRRFDGGIALQYLSNQLGPLEPARTGGMIGLRLSGACNASRARQLGRERLVT